MRNQIRNQAVATVMLCLTFFCSRANNILLSNITTGSNASGVYVQFDLSWDNSWRNTTNYDAAWVFFKFKDVTGQWLPLMLNNSNNASPGAYTIAVPSDNFGAFIYRTANGSGTNTITGIRLGIVPQPGSFDVKGFAIEMVNIPQGTFYVGDNQFSASSYHDGPLTNPYNVQFTVAGVTMGGSVGMLNDPFGFGPLQGNFPTGYLSYYIMKYELSFGGYRDFLNCITYDQQVSRTPFAPNSPANTQIFSTGTANRIKLKLVTPGVSNTTAAVYGMDANNNNIYDEAADGEWVAMAGLSYSDGAAYLDWAGLRLLSELEYEKAARGSAITPVTGEFAWGDSLIATLPYSVANSALTNEALTSSNSVTLGNANTSNNTPGGSFRNGVFASSVSTRKSAGASYYGVMEMTGNVAEPYAFTGNVAGRIYQPNPGDGILTAAGDANVDYWPGINGNNTGTVANTVYGGVTGTTGSAGAILRGGSFGIPSANCRVSARFGQVAATRSTSIGIRGGR